MIIVKEVVAWLWKCPYCHYEGIEKTEALALGERKEHMKECYKNPETKLCYSCAYLKKNRCNFFNINPLIEWPYINSSQMCKKHTPSDRLIKAYNKENK